MPYFAFVYNNFWFLAILVTLFTALQMRRGLGVSDPPTRRSRPALSSSSEATPPGRPCPG